MTGSTLVSAFLLSPLLFWQATALGAIMSICALAIMGTLFLCETLAFARNNIVTSIAVDENADPQIRLNFNITLLDLHCDFASVDVWDALGTNRQNVTRNIDKWQLDENGVKRIFSGRNREGRELEWEEHDKTLAEMHAEEGVHAVDLTASTFKDFLAQNEMTFIDMFAPWYVQKLEASLICFFAAR
jgi:Endoplasmic Reticulum-Golgi Intermediate Compartment (ERGIC)